MTAVPRWRFEPADVATRLRAASDELDALLASCGVPVQARYAARLVAEEIVLNAFEHGGARWVTLEGGSSEEPLCVVFEDDGTDFDAASLPLPGPESGDAEVASRGRGMALVRGLTRGIEHRREGGRNRLRVLLAP